MRYLLLVCAFFGAFPAIAVRLVRRWASPTVAVVAGLAAAEDPARGAEESARRLEVTPEQVIAVETALRVKTVLDDRGRVRAPPPRLLSAEQRRVLDIALDPAHAPPIRGDECDDGAFATNKGDALVAHIRSTPERCISRLFSRSPARFAAFEKRNMIHVAEATVPIAVAYDGTNSSNIAELFLFLRAGFYVEFYEGDELDWTEPDDDIAAAVADALDAFKDNARFYDETEEHFSGPLREGATLMDSSELQARYLPEAKSWLERWRPALVDTRGAIGAVNSFFVLLFRGHYLQAFVDAVADDRELIRILRGFALDDRMLDTDAELLAANAGRELARFSQYRDAPILADVREGIKAILERYDIEGEGRRVWVPVAAGALYYDDCEIYGICGFDEQLEADVLAVRHQCDIDVTIRAQDLEPDDLAKACALLEARERYFHRRLRTGATPVPDDFNESLEVVVFADSLEYGTYSTLFFGNDTNNGGIYLEGDPSDPANTARFIAYVATWLEDRPVWNLEHEQVHYLDGRFNLRGPFGDYRVDTHHTVWWAEGLAEYVSKGNGNRSAVDVGRSGDVKLSEVFPVVYRDGNTLVYRWSYLAVRFMFERHRDVVDGLLAYFRAGDYDGYLRHLTDDVGTSYDAEWAAWLRDVAATDDDTPDLVELPRRLAVDEGSTATYRIALAAEPAAAVRVDITAEGSEDIAVQPASLTFSPEDWDRPRTVGVTARGDDDGVDDAATLVHAASGGGYDTVRALVAVAVADSAPTISFVDAAVSVAEGGTAVLDVAIDRALESAATFGYRVGPDDDPATFDADAADHGAGDGEATIPAGETRARIQIPVHDDADIEPAREVVAVDLDPSTANLRAGIVRASVVIEEGVCDRTPDVRDLLRRGRPCESVTVADLADEWVVDFDDRRLGEGLQAGDFQGLTGAVDLRLDDTGLTALPAGLFSDMHSLNVLLLDYNDLPALPAGAFNGAGGLRWLMLNDNDLSGLPAGLFEGLGELTWLKMQGNPGAPFALTVEWHRLEDFTFAAVVREGAPFDMRADISVAGGTPSVDSVVVPAGSTVSGPVAVRPHGSGPVRVGFASTPAVPDDQCHGIPCFQGVTTAVGADLVVGGADDGVANVPTSYALPAGVERRIPLADLFPDIGTAAASYAATSSDPAALEVRIEDDVLVLSPTATAAAVVTVTAAQPGVTTILYAYVSVTVVEPVLARIPYFPSASDAAGRQGFLRVVGGGGRASALGIDVFDDDGVAAGSLVLSTGARGAVQVNSRDMLDGNGAKGLFGRVGAGSGVWRLALAGVPGIQVMSYVRTPDGLLASMHDLAPSADGFHRVATFNPGGNVAAESLLRLANPTAQAVVATIRATDDDGAPGGEVSAAIPARGSLTVSARELESGSAPGLSGALGDGRGKWRLDVESAGGIQVMSLLSSATGHLTNLSSAPSNRLGEAHFVPLFPSASDALARQGFVRVVNRSASAAEVAIAASDETDRDYGSLALTVGGNRTVHFNSDDLELGNVDKGLSGSVGPGEGDWWLELTSEADIEVLSYIRTPDGFLTSMGDVVPRTENRHRVPIFNPGRNTNEASRLRLINAGGEDVQVTITGVDDAGRTPGDGVRLSIPPGGVRSATAADLERGAAGFEGSIGIGSGKWQLVVETDAPIWVVNLLESATGHVANLSTASNLATDESNEGGPDAD